MQSKAPNTDLNEVVSSAHDQMNLIMLKMKPIAATKQEMHRFSGQEEYRKFSFGLAQKNNKKLIAQQLDTRLNTASKKAFLGLKHARKDHGLL
jgi:hypothetical protein